MFKVKNRFMEEEPGAGGGEGASLEDLTAQLAEANKNIEGLKSKNDELLGETKKAKNQKREAEELAKKEAEDAARANGDHEQLYKSSEEARLKLQNEHNDLMGSIANEKRDNAAMKLATELADGYNAEILSEAISKRLKWADGSIKVTDENGALTVSTLDELKTIFKNNERYASLLKGNQSSGGGASGGSNSGGAAKTMTREDFNALDPARQMKFMQSGGKTI
jgi:vacuolar-type H+-ATPase subunit I/STV1